MNQLLKLMLIFFLACSFFSVKSWAGGGESKPINGQAKFQLVAPFEAVSFCDASCEGGDAGYFEALVNISETDFLNMSEFKKEYDNEIAKKYPDRSLTQKFTAQQNQLIEERLFSNFDRIKGSYQAPEMVNPVSNPAELFFAMQLHSYQKLLQKPDTDKEALQKRLATSKEILGLAAAQVPPGKKLASCLVMEATSEKDEPKTICSQRTTAEWLAQLKYDEQNVEYIRQKREEMQKATIHALLDFTNALGILNLKVNQPKLSKEPLVNCYNELILSLQKNGIKNPAFIYNEGADLYNAMVYPNQPPKVKSSSFTMSQLYSSANEVNSVTVQKPIVKFCNGIKYSVIIKKDKYDSKNDKKYALIVGVEKPLAKLAANKDLIDVNQFKAYWKEQTPGFAPQLPKSETTDLANDEGSGTSVLEQNASLGFPKSMPGNGYPGSYVPSVR